MTSILIPTVTDVARIATSESLQEIIEGNGYGRVLGLDQAVSLVQDDEPILGLEATEFSREGLLHPERYQPIVRFVCTLAERAGLTTPRIIDLGCGPGILTSMIARELPGAQVMGVDISPDMLPIAASTTQAFGVTNRVKLHNHDARLVAGQAETQADIAVSRNMLHRVDGLSDALYRMVLAVKPSGGMVCISAFRQVSDLNREEQAAFITAVRERKGEENLVRAYVRAHLNAPSLAQYERAAWSVAQRLDVAQMRVWAGRSNNVGIYFQR